MHQHSPHPQPAAPTYPTPPPAWGPADPVRAPRRASWPVVVAAVVIGPVLILPILAALIVLLPLAAVAFLATLVGVLVGWPVYAAVRRKPVLRPPLPRRRRR